MFFPEDTKATKRALTDVAVRTLCDEFEPAFSAQVRPYTYVHYDVTIDGMKYSAEGFSKVCWPDEWDESSGMFYASRKAIRHIVRKVTRNRKADLIKLINSFEKPQTLEETPGTFTWVKHQLELEQKFPTVTPRLELDDDEYIVDDDEIEAAIHEDDMPRTQE